MPPGLEDWSWADGLPRSVGGTITLRNVVTGEERRTEPGTREHHELRALRHPSIWHRPLWEQAP
jgi:hypothetical protein